MLNDDRLSRRALLQLAAGASAATLAGRFPAAWGETPKSRAAEFQNPLSAGDFADPTILRVGGDFYFTHTSYRYAPGLVVWHSRDMVNWTPISHALADMRGTRAEVWAPEMVEHGGATSSISRWGAFLSSMPTTRADPGAPRSA